MDNILINQDCLCVVINNEQCHRKRGKKTLIGLEHSGIGVNHGGRRKKSQVAAHDSGAPMDAALRSSQGLTAKPTERACAARRRNVCTHWGFDADLVEFSINLTVTAERLGSGLQSCLFTSQPANMSPHAQSSSSQFGVYSQPFSDRDSFGWTPQLSACCSFHLIFLWLSWLLDIMNTLAVLLSYIEDTLVWFSPFFSPRSPVRGNQGVCADEIVLMHPHQHYSLALQPHTQGIHNVIEAGGSPAVQTHGAASFR